MCTSYGDDDEPTTATMNTDPFTFTQAHLSQEKTTPKKETEEQKKHGGVKHCSPSFLRKKIEEGHFWHFFINDGCTSNYGGEP